MAVYRITNITSFSAAGVVDGAVEATIKIDKVQRPSHADAEINNSFIDIPFVSITGTVTIDDEDAYLLCDGVTKIMVIGWKDHAGVARTTTIGTTTNGVMFTGYSLSAPANSADGPVFRWELTFEAVFLAANTSIADLLTTA